MPRQRKPDPSIPAHIDQRKLPVGCYWNRRDRNWYMLRDGKRSKPIAAADALLSDLHKAMELAHGADASTLDYMLGKFEESSQFKTEIGENTRTDYIYCRDVLQRHATKLGVTFANLRRGAITPPLIQRLVNDIAKDFPTKANHVKRYLSVAYQWGVLNGYAGTNVAQGVRQAKERKAHRMPEADTARAVIALLRARGAMPSRRAGSVPPYIWAVAEIAYRCRMRGVEVRMLTDANRTDAGIIVKRVKGSDGNLTTWCPELTEAWSWLVSRRARIWLKKPSFRAQKARPLVVSEDGAALSKSALNSAWRRSMAVAIEAGVIDKDSRFGLHGLKHRGVTDTPGRKADKKAASGHKTDAMIELYDHELQVVEPAGRKL
jgi:hypothetical protein